jgi:hypothetical protein
MKNVRCFKQTLLTSLLIVAPIFAMAAAGGAGPGGGDLTRSTIDQINKALDYNNFSNVLSDLVIQTKNESPIHLTDRKVIDAVRKMEADPLVSKIIKGKIQIGRANGIPLVKKYGDDPCFLKDHDLANRVAYAADGTKKAEICIQMQRFTRVPETALPMEIGAALINELIEIAGMPHSTGLYVQEYILKHYNEWCIIQIYPSDAAQAQGQPDRYRIFLRDLQRGVSLKWGSKNTMEWLNHPYPNASQNTTMAEQDEESDLSRMTTHFTTANTSFDDLLSTMLGRDRTLNKFKIGKESSSVQFQTIDRAGEVHHIVGSWGKVEPVMSIFYKTTETGRNTIHFTFDGRPLEIRSIEFYEMNGCFPQ